MAETAVSLDPEFAVGYETLAQALEKAGRLTEAQAALQHADAIRAAEDDEDD
jgi:hypothetical protein